MPSVLLTYECLACHAISDATVTGLDDPVASIAPRTQGVLRQTRAIMVQAGREQEGDPVAELADEILHERGRSELLYATCPRCGAKNPEGVAERAKDQRRWRWITAAILVAFAAGAWFVRWIALVFPALDLLVFRPMGIAHARRSGEPLRWLPLLGTIAMDIAIIALVVLVPRAAPLVPLLPAVLLLVRKPAADEQRWRDAAEKIRFEDG